MLVILSAVKKWSSYLIGRQFLIKTDHNSLTFLLDQQTATPAQHKWLVKMMGYDFKLTYREGSSNIVADALSRISAPVCIAMSTFDTGLLQRIKNSWVTNPIAAQLIDRAKTTTNTAGNTHGRITYSREKGNW